MAEVLLSILLGAAAGFSFWWFWKTNPGLRLWWLRTPTSHALAIGSGVLAFALLQPASPFLPFLFQFSGTLLALTGFGYCIGFFLVHRKTKQRPAQNQSANLLIYTLHLFGGGAGIYLFAAGFSTTENAVLPLAAAFVYLTLIGAGFIQRKI